MDCLACGITSSPPSREHVFAQWLLDALGGISMNFYRRHGDGRREIHRKTINLRSFTLKRICEDCNNGWMCRLEEALKPILLPLLKGAKHLEALDEDERRILAKWLGKTAIIDSYAIGAECPVDKTLLRWMARDERSTPGRFGVAACPVPLNGVGHFQFGKIHDLFDGGKAAGQIMAIALPGVVFVCGFPMLAEAPVEYRCVRPNCFPLWPTPTSWRPLEGKPVEPGLDELETMMSVAEWIEVFQPLNR
jgi:hypothetical protein